MELNLRIGKIIEAETIKDIVYTTHKLVIDFGKEIGTKVSYANLSQYTKEDLVGKLIVGVVNLPPKKIGSFMSEVLILGTPNEKNECILISTDREGAQPGSKVY